jgi:hypothetical protein
LDLELQVDNTFQRGFAFKKNFTYPNYTNRCSISNQIFFRGVPFHQTIFILKESCFFLPDGSGATPNNHGVDEGPSVQVDARSYASNVDVRLNQTSEYSSC